jgi:hypothetical protein
VYPHDPHIEKVVGFRRRRRPDQLAIARRRGSGRNYAMAGAI